ncbi:MAG: ATP-binding protein [Verrucomicrobia bacterium]|nr:ATP-binding protein [Verrucomicrobiota bacterium]
MIERTAIHDIRLGLREAPAVCLLGPRQVGKTTLAHHLAEEMAGIYLDLESPADLAKLSDPEAYLSLHLDKLVVLDEVHRFPGLFPSLRGLIDRARRQGTGTGRYLLLGSASLDLLRQSGESLAGRLHFTELTAFHVGEPVARPLPTHWLRGGFPGSLLATSDAASLRWRRNFIRTYLERDIPQFGGRMAQEALARLWTMLAHRQGAPLNLAELARSLGADTRTIGGYVDLMCDLFLLRRLPPWHANVGKRLVKSPRVYLRDSGVLHALLGLESSDALLGHPVAGASWEGFVIENLLASAPEGTRAHYYRTGGGAEMDLLLELPGAGLWAVEIKRSTAPAPSRGFHESSADLRPTRRFIVYPGTERFPLGDGIEAIPLPDLANTLVAGGK